MSWANRTAREVGATLLVMLVAGCGPAEVTDNAQAATPATVTPPAVASPLPANLSGPAGGQASPGSAMPGAISCPATLSAGTPLPRGARLIGAPLGQGVALSSATVTADNVTAIKGDLSGLAEVEPEEGPTRAGMVVQYQDAEPSRDAPYTLICRYGRATVPLLAQSVLLVPLTPRPGRYRCATELPQGRDPRRARAYCSPA